MAKKVSPLGQRIYHLMDRVGLPKQADLIRATKQLAEQQPDRFEKIAPSTLSRLIFGTVSNPRQKTLATIAEALQTTVAELLGERVLRPLPDPVSYFRDYFGVDDDVAKAMRDMVEVLHQLCQSKGKRIGYTKTAQHRRVDYDASSGPAL